MLKAIWNQNNRAMCRSAIKEVYLGEPELRAERRRSSYYYSVWGIQNMLLEAVYDRAASENEVKIYTYHFDANTSM